MSRSVSWTDRRVRFDHLIGVDRFRVVCLYADRSFATESFEDVSIEGARTTATAVVAPDVDRPVLIEIRLGHWVAVGSNDCEWFDICVVATGEPTPNGICWTNQPAQASGSTPTIQLELSS